MPTTSVKERAGDRVYHAIKASVIAFEFPQGKRIYLDPIARQFGVSVTPVREALIRLAAEGLVIAAPQKGFFAMTLSEEVLLGQYELTRLLLSQGLEMLDPATRRKLPEYEPAAGVLNKLNRRVLFDVKTLATYTGEIFAHIAALTKNAYVEYSIGAANDRLFFIRMHESQHLDNVQSELTNFCQLLLSDRCDELISAIHMYHDRRIALLPTLFRTLR